MTRALIAFVLAATLALPQKAARLTGTWVGAYKTATSTGAVTLKIDSTATGWTAEILAASDKVPNQAFTKATDVKVRGDSIEFSVKWGTPVIWAGKLTAKGLSGDVAAQYWTGTWTAERRVPKAKGG